MNNILLKNPIIIKLWNVFDFSEKTFIFIAGAPDSVISETQAITQDFNKTGKIRESKILKDYFENWKEKLGFKKLGGDFAGLLDLDTQESETRAADSVTVVTEVQLFPEDKIIDLKKKLYLVSWIKNLEIFQIYNQHIFVKTDNQVIPLSYQITNNKSVYIDIQEEFLNPSRETIFNIPVDTEMYNNKLELSVSGFDYKQSIRDVILKSSSNIFYLVNLESVLSENLSEMKKLEKTNDIQNEIFYYGFVLKFWPMISRELFSQILLDSSEIKNNFPDTQPDLKTLKDNILLENKILNQKYLFWQNNKLDIENLNFQKFTTVIKNLVIKSKEVNYKSQINSKEVFDSLALSKLIPIIRVSIVQNNIPVILTKIKSSFENYNILEQIRNKINLPFYNAVLLVIKSRDIPDLIFTLTIKSNSMYSIKFEWVKMKDYNFSQILEFTKAEINPVIQEINKLGRQIFNGQTRLQEIRRENIEFTNACVDIIWNKNLAFADFENLKEFLIPDFNAGLIEYKEINKSIEDFEFNMMKFKKDYDLDAFKRESQNFNFYSHLVDSNEKQNFFNFYILEKTIRVEKTVNEVKFASFNFSESELLEFFLYFIPRLLEYEKTKFTKKQKQVQIQASKLHELDPKLFDLKKESSVVYSRICQGNKKPNMYSEEEYKKVQDKTDFVKYWNFTYKEPVYYACNDSVYKYVNFIPGHPKNYCLPCCSKVKAEDNKSSKKYKVFETCLKTHKFADTGVIESSSRYVVNYGNDLPVFRISRLPSLLLNYFKNNLTDEDLTNEICSVNKIFTVRGDPDVNNYSIKMLARFAKKTKVREMDINKLKSIMREKIWRKSCSSNLYFSPQELLENPEISLKYYEEILKADPNKPIMLYKDSQLVDGITSLAKSFLESKKKIKYYPITDNQLEKSRLTEKDKLKINSDQRNSGLYLFGVQQYLNSAGYIGAVFSIADIIGISAPEFVKRCIDKLTESNIFEFLLNGRVAQYFSDKNALITELESIFLPSNNNFVFSSQFPYWNELAIEFARIYFNLLIVIFDDKQLITKGTSLKKTSNEVINIKLYTSFSNINEIIPDFARTVVPVYDFAFILRNIKSRNFSNINYNYYPIYIITPFKYFNKQIIDKKIFSISDKIVQLTKDLIKTDKNNNFSITLPLKSISDFANNNSFRISKCFIDTEKCYAVELIKENILKIIIPVSISSYKFLLNTETPPELIFSLLTRTQISQDYKTVKKFIIMYNTFLANQAKSAGKLTFNTSNLWPASEIGVTPASPFIRVSKILVFNNSVIGFSFNNLNFYFNSLKKENLTEFLKYYSRGVSGYYAFKQDIKTLEPRSLIQYLICDPDTVNKEIKDRKPPKDARVRKLAQAVYSTYSYDLYFREFMNYLDSETNPKLKKQIIDLVSNNIIKNKNYSKMITQLADLLKEFPQDIEIIRFMINKYFENYKSKALLSNLETADFAFNKITFNKIISISAGFKTIEKASPEKTKSELIKIISEVNSKIIEPGLVKLSEFSDTICSSGEKTAFCKNKKLILEKKNLKIFTDILAGEFLNPLKHEYLKSAFLFLHEKNKFTIQKKSDEQIYIKV